MAPLSILDAGSQEMLAMLSGPAPRERPPQPKHSWLAALAGGALRPDLPGAAAPAQKPVSPPLNPLPCQAVGQPLNLALRQQ